MAPRTGKRTFHGCVIAMAGGKEDWTEAQVENWVKRFGGEFSRKIDDNVTHILTSMDDFKQARRKKLPSSAPLVSALKMERHRRRKSASGPLHIVTHDWLEDSIDGGTKPKRRPEANYSLIEEEKKKNAKAKLAEKDAKGVEEAKTSFNSNKFHEYRCRETGFCYNVTLTHQYHEYEKDKEDEDKASCQRHIVKIFESNAEPHLYWVLTKYQKKARAKYIDQNLTDSPVTLEVAMKKFCRFFRAKTKIQWNDRIVKNGTKNPDKYFKYQAPGKEQPVGPTDGTDYRKPQSRRRDTREGHHEEPDDRNDGMPNTMQDTEVATDDVERSILHDISIYTNGHSLLPQGENESGM